MPVRENNVDLATPVKVMASGTKYGIRHASGTVSASGDKLHSCWGRAQWTQETVIRRRPFTALAGRLFYALDS